MTLSRLVQPGLALVFAAALAAGCGWRGGATSDASVESTSAVPAVTSSRMSIAASKPVDAYVLLGGRIKTCWFNPEDPLLPDHVYRADVSPDGSKVKITVHQALKLGRAGTSAYAIDFKQEGPFTVVTTENRKMPPEMAAKMQFDIDRWKRGEANCSKEMPKVAAQPKSAQ